MSETVFENREKQQADDGMTLLGSPTASPFQPGWRVAGGQGAHFAVPPPGVLYVYPSWLRPSRGAAVRSWTGEYVDTTGSTTSGLAEAQAYLASLGRAGVVQLFEGTYTLTADLELDTDNTEIRGAGPGTIITMDATNGTVTHGIIDIKANRCAVRDLKIVGPSGLSSSTCIAIEIPDGSDLEDIEITGVHIDQQRQNQEGIRMRNSNASGGQIDRLTIRNCLIEYTATNATWDAVQVDNRSIGIGLSVKSGDGYDLVMDNVRVIGGWLTGINSNSNSGGAWHRSKITNLLVKGSVRRGARFYHFGESQISNSEFRDCDVGAFFDSGALNQGWTVDNCRFIDNAVCGAYMEEWEASSMNACLFQGNDRGLWVSAARYCTFSNIRAIDNTESGIVVDADDTLTASVGDNYTLSNANSIQDISFTGCQCIRNAGNGLEILGALRGITVTGGVYSRNGTSLGSTDAGIYIGQDTSGTSTAVPVIVGASFVNSVSSPAEDDQDFGIYEASGEASGYVCDACYFESIDDPHNAPTGAFRMIRPARRIVTVTTGTTNLDSASNYLIICDTSTGLITVNLPDNPFHGMSVILRDKDGQAGTNNVTLGRNTLDIEGAAVDVTLSTADFIAEYVYDEDATSWWKIRS